MDLSTGGVYSPHVLSGVASHFVLRLGLSQIFFFCIYVYFYFFIFIMRVLCLVPSYITI